MTDIGQMRHRITIEQPVRASDGMGGATVTWSTVLNSWAQIAPASAREAFFAGRLEGNVSHKLRMRYRSGITPAMRVKFSGWGSTRYFQIHGVLNDEEKNRFLTLLCEEGKAS